MIINYTNIITPEVIEEKKEIEIEDIYNCYFKYESKNYNKRKWFVGLFRKDKTLEYWDFKWISENIYIKIENKNIEYDRTTGHGYFFENKIRELYESCSKVIQITEKEFFEELEKFKDYLNK